MNDMDLVRTLPTHNKRKTPKMSSSSEDEDEYQHSSHDSSSSNQITMVTHISNSSIRGKKGHFVCGICEKFQSVFRDTMDKHILKRHLTCRRCKKVCDTVDDCYQHYDLVHRTALEPEPVVRDESEFVCEQCKQPFESKAQLDAHTNSNSQEHPCAIPLHPRWYCNFSTCTVSYVSYRRLQAHYREAHTTLVDTACVRCNRAFPTLQHLQQHHQSNPRCDIATFRCTVGDCQLQLDDSVAMQAHVMYHIDNGDALGDVLAHHNQ